jgi:hypothetical protein
VEKVREAILKSLLKGDFFVLGKRMKLWEAVFEDCHSIGPAVA